DALPTSGVLLPHSVALRHSATPQPATLDAHSKVDPLLPIPNRTVKRLRADDSGLPVCESRSSSGSYPPKPQHPFVLGFCLSARHFCLLQCSIVAGVCRICLLVPAQKSNRLFIFHEYSTPRAARIALVLTAPTGTGPRLCKISSFTSAAGPSSVTRSFLSLRSIN